MLYTSLDGPWSFVMGSDDDAGSGSGGATSESSGGSGLVWSLGGTITESGEQTNNLTVTIIATPSGGEWSKSGIGSVTIVDNSSFMASGVQRGRE